VPIGEIIASAQEVPDVDTQEAFETLLGELQHAFEKTQETLEDAVKQSDFSAIREAAGRGEAIQRQIDDLKALHRQWEDIVGAGTAEGAKRAPRGASTPQKAYRVPILRALEEMGGQGRTAEVVDRVGEMMEDQFTEWDRQMLPSGTDIRWRNKAQWARNSMVNDGLLAPDSPYGIWEITEKGREVLHKHRNR
jgi:restriction system protein